MRFEAAEAIRRAHWVDGYRLAHRDADRWADSPSGIRHGIETQDRIFRMAEQLLERDDWPTATPFFPVLIALDDVAAGEVGDDEVPTAISASAAGVVGYKILFGKLPPVRDHDWPDDCELSDQAGSELATFGLRARGFDPVVFDGNDPAAYVWALFEIAERQAACDEVIARHEHRAHPPRGLAVVAAPVRQPEPGPLPLRRSAQLAGVGR
jgi:hypothetical protein